LSDAVRIAQGQVFARDFIDVMWPGTFYWLAAFFKLFGITFLASRICLFVSSLGTALSVYFLSRRVCQGYRTLPCLVLAGTYAGAFWRGISHHVDSNFFALLAVACMVLWQARPRNSLLIAGGALAGMTACTLQQKGVLLFCAFLVWLWLQRRRIASPLSSIGMVSGGFVGVVGLMLLYFWTKGVLGYLIYATVILPHQHYAGVNTVPYAQRIFTEYWDKWVMAGGSTWFLPIAAILIVPFLFIAALPALLLAFGIRYNWRSVTPELALYWLCGWALWLSEFHRKDVFHLVFGSPLLIVLCIHILGESRRKIADLSLQMLAISAVLLAFFNCCVTIAHESHFTQTRVGMVAGIDSDRVLKFLNEHVSPGEDILFYPNAASYYFLSATTNPTRYSALQYNSTPPAVFREVVGILEQKRVRYVVWDTGFEAGWEAISPGSSPKNASDRILEFYLQSHYRVVENDDGIWIMERK
jgi:4-amino-4-deoxy-L-arabinose transferase-like glycosyltransferase